MNVPQEELDAWRRQAGEVRGQINALKHQTPPTAPAWETLLKADDAARRLALALERGGAARPDGMAPRREVPLQLLDTDANRRYLRALQAARDAGKEVDAERYGPGEDGPAAGGVAGLLAGVELEVLGPVGLLTE